MHMVEAFLAAFDASGDPVWARAGAAHRDAADGRGARADDWRVPEHFDERWTPLPDYNADEPRHPFRPYGVTPGHGLEWARLLLHLRAALDDPPDWLEPAARGLADRAWADGWDEERGGFAYTTDHDGRPVVADRFHWVVCEAIATAAVLGDAERERPRARLRRAPPDRPRARRLAARARPGEPARRAHLAGAARTSTTRSRPRSSPASRCGRASPGALR